MHIWQAGGSKRQGWQWVVADDTLGGFFRVAVQRVLRVRLAFTPRDQAYAAVQPLLGAGPQHLHTVQPEFDIHTAVDHKFTVFVQQTAVLRFDRCRKGHTAVGQGTGQDLADLDTVHD
ncbi:hypothetical protein D3C80_1401240 [compost metagenome]